MAEPAQFTGRAAPGGRPRSAMVVGALIVASLGLAVAKPWEQPRPSPPPSAAVAVPSVTPTGGGTLPIQAPPTPTPVFPLRIPFTLRPPPATGAPWTDIRWQHVDATHPLAHFGTALRWAGGYASLGDDGMGGTRLWTSPDGHAWNPIGSGTATTFWPGVHVESVAPLGRRLLAVTSLPAPLSPANPPSSDPASAGPSAPQSVVFASWLSEDGSAWQMRGGPILTQPTRLSGPVLVAGSGDHAVIGWDAWPEPGGETSGHLAVTADGASWQPLPASALPSGFQVTALVAAPGGGFLAAGKSVADGLASAALLRSDATGQAWTPVALPQDLAFEAGARANVVWRLVVAAGGVLAIGDSSARELWWWSADGRRWTAVPGFDPVGASGCPGSSQGCGAYADGMVAGDCGRAVAVGGAVGHAALTAWVSADARHWRRLGSLGVVPRDRPSGIMLLPGGIVLLGSTGAWYGEAVSGR